MLVDPVFDDEITKLELERDTLYDSHNSLINENRKLKKENQELREEIEELKEVIRYRNRNMPGKASNNG